MATKLVAKDISQAISSAVRRGLHSPGRNAHLTLLEGMKKASGSREKGVCVIASIVV